MSKRVARDGESELAAFFTRWTGIPSRPGLFDGSRLDSGFETSGVVVFLLKYFPCVAPASVNHSCVVVVIVIAAAAGVVVVVVSNLYSHDSQWPIRDNSVRKEKE